MSRIVKKTQTTQPQPELTHEEKLAKINEMTSLRFSRLREQAEKDIESVKAKFANANRHLSETIGWEIGDIVKAEFHLVIVEGYESMVSLEDESRVPKTPWEAAIYIYKDVRKRILEYSSFHGLDVVGNSTNPVANGIAHYRFSALRSILEYDLSFVKYFAEELNTTLSILTDN